MKGQIKASFSTKTARQVWKISLRLKGSSRCGVSTENNGSLWWIMVAVGDRERAWKVGNGFGRKKEKKMTFFLTRLKTHE